MVTFTVNLQPYQHRLTDLKTELNALQTTFQTLPDLHLGAKLNDAQRQEFVRLANQTAKLVTNELNQFWHEYYQLDDSWIQLLTLLKGKPNSIRPTRAILPVIGNLMSLLFGTATKRDMDGLRKGLLQLKDSQSKMVSVLENGLILLNKTNIAVAQNRRSLNRLVNATDSLHSLVSTLRFKILSVEPLAVFAHLQTKLQHVFHIVLSSFRQILWDVQILSTAIRDANKGRLPMTLISPTKLINTLEKIAKQMPQGFQLPRDHTKNIQWYYRNLRSILLPQNNAFHIVIAVPLARTDSIFTIYEAFSIPIPHPKLDLVVRYSMETTHIAISTDKTSYVMLSGSELSKCVTADTTYCSFRQPVRSIAHSPSCVSALFLKDNLAIKNVCTRKLTTHDHFPTVYYLQNGKWLIATRSKFAIHVSCPGSNKQNLYTHEITQTLQIVVLKSGCTGYSRHFKLLPYFYKQLTDSAQPVLTKPTIISSLLANIWNFSTIEKSQLNKRLDISKLLLENVTPLPIAPLQSVLDRAKLSIQTTVPKNDAGPSTILIITITLLVASVLFGIALVVLYCYYKKYVFNAKVGPVRVVRDFHDDECVVDNLRLTAVNLTCAKGDPTKPDTTAMNQPTRVSTPPAMYTPIVSKETPTVPLLPTADQ